MIAHVAIFSVTQPIGCPSNWGHSYDSSHVGIEFTFVSITYFVLYWNRPHKTAKKR